jgi:preprotein translocase subunit SecD
MLFTPLWKRILIWGVVALGVVGALPNVFYTTVERHNDALAAQELGTVLTPEQEADLAGWPNALPSALVNLGLDLRGGAHLLAEVQVSDVYKTRIDALWPEVRDTLRELGDQVGRINRLQSGDDGVLRVEIGNAAGMPAALEAVNALADPVVTLTGAGQSTLDVQAEGQEIVIQLSEAERAATDTRTLQQSVEIVRRRVDEAGTREPTIQRQGADRILIQVPGIGSAEELKELIGQTAKLTFNRVIRPTSDPGAAVGAGEALLPAADNPGLFYLIEDAAVVSGDNLVDSQPSFDENNRPAVSFRFDTTGARAFGDYTAANIGQLFAIVLDGEVISAPEIIAHIPGGSGIITGRFTVEESTQLAILLRAGALPAELNWLEERTVGPELGQDSIDAGRVAAVVAMLAVVAYMIASYGLFGVFANIALAFNMALIFAVLSAVGGTLTLPGIAGLVLTIGMAVDANVLVYERIREELRIQKSAARAIEIGYEKAMSAIIDANITTFITAVVLYVVGAGPVRGFAIVLGVGIITSVFTALFVTRLLIAAWFNWRKPKTVIV